MQHPQHTFPIARIRKDFPILAQEIHGKQLVYLDSAASAQQPRHVLKAMQLYAEQHHANVHRGVHTLSQRATELFESARVTCQHFLGAQRAEEIVFTHGTTEAINLIAQGWAAPRLGPEDEIAVTALEHHANFIPWQHVALRTGATLRVLPFDAERGSLCWEALDGWINEKTALVAVAHASNVLGSVLPIEDIIQKAHSVGAVVVVDGAQTVPHMPIDVAALGCDFFVCSGHKMYGPTGIGLLYGSFERLDEMEPLMLGGGMIEHVSIEHSTFQPPPARFEAGTPPIADALGLQAAIRYIEEIGRDEIAAYEHQLSSYMWERMQTIEGIQLWGTMQPRVGVVSFSVSGVHPYDIGQLLDIEGVAIRTGHHCAQPLMASLGVSGTARASVGMYSTFSEIDTFVDALEWAIQTLKM